MVKGTLQPMTGVLPVLQQLHTGQVPMAVASSSPIRNIEALLKELRITPYFDAILSVGNLPGKPDPAVFLEAARQLQTPPGKCVVFEDSIAGVRCQAGDVCIALTTTTTRTALQC